MDTFDVLGLVDVEEHPRRGPDGLPLRYVDVTVNGVRLLLEVMSRTGADVVGPFVRSWAPDMVIEVFERLLGDRPAELPGGRTWLNGCTQCGDIGCGAVTVELSFTPTTVRWARMSHENSYENEIFDLEPLAVLDRTFDRATYEALLRQALREWRLIAEDIRAPGHAAPRLPVAGLAHQGRSTGAVVQRSSSWTPSSVR